MTPTHATKDKKKRYRYYLCTAAQKRGRQACPSPSIPAGEIERFLVEQIKCIGRDPQLVAETVHQTQMQTTQRMDELDAEKRRLEREIASFHHELQQLVRHTGAVEQDGLAAARFADLQERIASAERRLLEVRDEADALQRDRIDEADVAQALAQFDPVWEALSPREQARLLQLLIERIDYDGRDGEVSITFHASGIKALASRNTMGGAA
jgi:site-specific DNA recombinase